ncbi:MAG: hypothetical protein Aurels2KO_16980 [Aureliella sp.]
MIASSLLTLAWPIDIAENPLVYRLGWVILHTLWQFLVVALVAAACYRILRQASASARYVVLMAANFLIAVAPIATWFSLEPREPTSITERTPTASPAQSYRASAPQLAHTPLAAATDLPVLPEQVGKKVNSSQRIMQNWWQIIQAFCEPWLPMTVLLWCLGVLMCAVRPFCGWLHVRRICRTGTRPPDDEVADVFKKLCAQMQLKRHAQVLVSTVVQSPVVVGAFRSVILLPANFVATASLDHLNAILAHELAHIRRYDYLVNLAQTLMETLFFYHPGVWWISNRLRIERENCCDDLAARVVQNRVEYGRALLAVEELRAKKKQLAIGAHDGTLTHRVKRLFDIPERDSRGSGIWAVGLLVTMAVLGLVGTSIFADDSSDDGDETAKEPSFFIATLDKGIAVELFAIRRGSDGEVWRADGTRFETSPTLPEFGDTARHKLGDNERQCFLRWVELERDRGIAIDAPDWRTLYSLKKGENISRLLVERKEAEFVDFRVSVTDEEWGPWIKVDPKGQVIGKNSIPTAYREVYELIKPDHIDGLTTVTNFCWRGLHSTEHRAQSDVVAIDTNGKRLDYYARTAWNGPDRVESAEVFKLPLGEIDHFEYRLRPFRYHATFVNVALDPQGKGSNVSVTVKQIPIAAQGKEQIQGVQLEPQIKVTGTVVDEDGQPIEGAHVCATCGPKRSRVETKSDQDGNFEFSVGADARGIQLRIIDQAGIRMWVGPIIGQDETGRVSGIDSPLIAQLAPATRSKVTVVCEGAPVSDATIVVQDELKEIDVLKSDARGQATAWLPEGSVPMITAFRPGVGYDYYSAYVRNRVKIPVAIPEEITLRLSGAKKVRLRVVDTAGAPISGATVRPWFIDLEGNPGRTNFASQALAITTDEQGIAVFDWIPTSTKSDIVILANAEGFHRYRLNLRRDAIGAGQTQDIVLQTMTELNGHVVDAKGEPVPGAFVIAFGLGPDRAPTANSGETDTDGRFTFSLGPDRAYAIYAKLDSQVGYAKPVLVREGSPIADVEIALQAGVNISGKVTSSASHVPVKETRLLLSCTLGTIPQELEANRAVDAPVYTTRFPHFGTTDSEGQYSFTVPPGDYKLQLQGQELDLQAGSRKLTVKDKPLEVNFHIDDAANGIE